MQIAFCNLFVALEESVKSLLVTLLIMKRKLVLKIVKIAVRFLKL